MKSTGLHDLDDVDVYLNGLRLDILVRLGVKDEAAMEPGPMRDELDSAVLRFAGRTLAMSEKFTLYFLFAGAATWEDIQSLFFESLGRTLDKKTVIRYANRALAALGPKVTSSIELQQWLRQRQD